MCGITGAIALSEKGSSALLKIEDAVQCLLKRGPDSHRVYRDKNIAFGHSRLSIIDTSEAGNQPMTDASGRFTIILNGEFFNFKEHRDFVRQNNISLRSGSDTEVLLYLYILEGEKCLDRINGFFAFAIYDKIEETVFIARDRMGIKPLLYFQDADRFLFASELKSLMALGIPKILDESSLFTYLQLNYIPGPHSIFKNIYKLDPGHYFKINLRNKGDVKVKKSCYYSIPKPSVETPGNSSLSYHDQKVQLRKLLEASVSRRMISDVPLGAFLSGGLDSSIIVSLAAKQTSQLKTFSIGFRDEPSYDETKYAEMVALKYKTSHTAFSLTNDDLFNHLFDALDYLDEPFADSSALNVFILSKETRKHVTVALSGDGADELFGGYNKHSAELSARSALVSNFFLRSIHPVLKHLPQSRQTTTGNFLRKANKMAHGLSLSSKERYWRWAGFESETEVLKLLQKEIIHSGILNHEYKERKQTILREIGTTTDLNDVLLTDMHLVLVNDMLTKVDMMSMANSLEVRVPFLDYTVVDFVSKLPASSKIDSTTRKKLLRETFAGDLPPEIFTRSKQGFEVPLLKWFRNELNAIVMDDLLADDFIHDQKIFNPASVRKLKQKLMSFNPGDSPAQIWALVVFQHFWRKWIPQIIK